MSQPQFMSRVFPPMARYKLYERVDDPRFDEFYREGNEARLLTALLLTDMPSYTGLGLEIRDLHFEPAPNEHYTKLFVFEETDDSNVYPSKARFTDDYTWGTNDELFGRLRAVRVLSLIHIS